MLFLVIGIINGSFISFNDVSAVVIGSIILILLLLSLRFTALSRLYPLYVVITGILLVQGINYNNINYPEKITPDFKGFFKGQVKTVLSQKEYQSKYIVSGYLNPNISDPFDTRILLTVFEKNKQKKLRAGDSILADLTIRTPQKLNLQTDFNEVAYARSQNFQFYATSNSKKISLVSSAGGFEKLLSDLRANIKVKLKLLFSDETYPIILALITGDKSNIDYSVKQDFSITGTAHVLAVSGLHVGIISGIILVLLGWLRNRKIKFALFCIILTGYVVLTGMQPSAMRAGAMSILIFIAYLHQRHINLLNIVAFAVIVLIVIDPSLIYSIGFQMSSGALIGISLFLTPILKFFDKLFPSENSSVKFCKTSLALTFSVMIVVSSIIAFYFRTFSVISPLANLLIVPLISVVMIYGILALSLSFIFLPLALLYSGVSEMAISLIRIINRWLSDFSFAQVDFTYPALMSILISILLIYIFYSGTKRQALFRFAVSSFIIILTFNLTEVQQKDKIVISPRKNIVLVRVQNDRGAVNMILDRKPHIYPSLDFSLFNYLEKSEKRIDKNIYLINGNCGIRLIDELKKKGKVNYHEINLVEIRKLLSALDLDCRIFQEIDLTKY